MSSTQGVRIALLHSFVSNIGNGIISEGAEYAIKQAIPDAEIFPFSDMPQYAEYNMSKIVSRIMIKIAGAEYITNKEYFATNYLFKFASPDLIVIPGCSLDFHAILQIFPYIKYASKNKIPYILAGAGGETYSESTVKVLKSILKRYPPAAIITRDRIAYEKYSDTAKDVNVYLGTDFGFFISDKYPSIKTKRHKNKYIVLSFDKLQKLQNILEKELKKNRNDKHDIIHVHHNTSDYTTTNTIISMISALVLGKTVRKNFFVSDRLIEYVSIYANASKVYTDRVHAAVTALSYNVPVRLYRKTERAHLFDGITSGDIYKELVTPAADKLNNMKRKVVSVIRKAINDAL